MSNFSKENTVGKSEKNLKHSECQSAFISSFYAVYEAYFDLLIVLKCSSLAKEDFERKNNSYILKPKTEFSFN